MISPKKSKAVRIYVAATFSECGERDLVTPRFGSSWQSFKRSVVNVCRFPSLTASQSRRHEIVTDRFMPLSSLSLHPLYLSPNSS